MIINKQHIIFRILTLCLVATLFFPVAKKLGHIFEHHDHVVCKGGNSTHIHQVDLDCEFQKFNLKSNYLHSSIHFELTEGGVSYFKTDFYLKYKFLYNHRPLSFSLRGPPFLV